MTEIWKPSIYTLDYEVSDFGRVKSFKRGKIKILKPKLDKDGYSSLVFSLGSSKNRKYVRVHAEILNSFVGLKPNENYLALHKNDDKSDNRLENLYWGTHQDNCNDKIINGGQVLGENHPNAKLKDYQIEEIKNLKNMGLSYHKIAKIYNVHEATIWCIFNRNSHRAMDKNLKTIQTKRKKKIKMSKPKKKTTNEGLANFEFLLEMLNKYAKKDNKCHKNHKKYKMPKWAVGQTVRFSGLVEDTCEHGVGHPNSEWLKEHGKKYDGIHGCDGCCSRKVKNVNKKS